jgi:hypothetical protein
MASRRAQWRRVLRLSTLGQHCRPARLIASRALQLFGMPPHARVGAGEGHRTRVVSLEGFCSTIELHPPAGRQCHCHREGVNRLTRLTRRKAPDYHASRMMSLVAIAALPTARFWWRGRNVAARWRD